MLCAQRNIRQESSHTEEVLWWNFRTIKGYSERARDHPFQSLISCCSHWLQAPWTRALHSMAAHPCQAGPSFFGRLQWPKTSFPWDHPEEVDVQYIRVVLKWRQLYCCSESFFFFSRPSVPSVSQLVFIRQTLKLFSSLLVMSELFSLLLFQRPQIDGSASFDYLDTIASHHQSKINTVNYSGPCVPREWKFGLCSGAGGHCLDSYEWMMD